MLVSGHLSPSLKEENSDNVLLRDVSISPLKTMIYSKHNCTERLSDMHIVRG